jgi:hypothetical protein
MIVLPQIISRLLVRGYQHLGENVTKQKKDWHEGIDYYKETTEEDNTRFNNKLGILLGTLKRSFSLFLGACPAGC